MNFFFELTKLFSIFFTFHPLLSIILRFLFHQHRPVQLCTTKEISGRHSTLAGKLNIGEKEDTVAEGNGKTPSPLPLKGGEWNNMLLV